MERRIHVRSPLRLQVWLLKADSTLPIRTVTEDVSNNGFFAYTELQVLPGDELAFFLQLPTVSSAADGARGICVYGQLKVVRVTLGYSGSRSGLGCHLTTYRVLPDINNSSIQDVVQRTLVPPIPASVLPLRVVIHARSCKASTQTETHKWLAPFLL